MKKITKIVFLSALGGALEFYDFVIFVLFAGILSKLFFPEENHLAALMGIFAIFAIGYLIRPIGGILFGHFGDKKGRKATFVISVGLMAIPTFLIGLLPSSHDIGITATILLVMLRILQGLAVGGEVPGALTFAAEHATVQYRGLICGFIFFGLNMGIILGSVINALLTYTLTQEQLLHWGWRLPFLFGGLLGIVSYYLRKHMHETPIFQQLTITKKSNFPLKDTLKNEFKSLFFGTMLTWLEAVVVCLLYLYLPTYFKDILHYPKKSVDLYNTSSLILFSCFIVFAGGLSDRIGRKLIIAIGAVGLLLLAYPLFYFAISKNFPLVILTMIVISMLAGCISGGVPCVLIDMFPPRVRYTSIAVVYNVGFAIFGGLSPLLATYLIARTDNLAAPSFYLIVSAIACLIGIFILMPKNPVSGFESE